MVQIVLLPTADPKKLPKLRKYIHLRFYSQLTPPHEQTSSKAGIAASQLPIIEGSYTSIP